jgi:hypothetical protein
VSAVAHEVSAGGREPRSHHPPLDGVVGSSPHNWLRAINADLFTFDNYGNRR